MWRKKRGRVALSMLTRSFLGDTFGFPREPRMHPPSKRGQIALSMLTRFSMVFFIMILAVIMISFSENQKQALCTVQANALAKSVASTLTNVINSPSEDERKVMALQPALLSNNGNQNFERYWLELTNRPSETNPNAGSIRVEAKTNTACAGGASAAYDSSVVVDSKTLIPKRPFLVFPSNTTVRDFYLVLVRCKPKKPPIKNYLFLEVCRGRLTEDVDPNACLPLRNPNNPNDPNDRVDKCCGWRPGPAQCN